MEQLDRIGDVFEAATGGITNAITKLFGSSNERRVRQLGFVRGKDGSTTSSPAPRSTGSTSWNRSSKSSPTRTAAAPPRTSAPGSANGETLDDLLPEAFARVREASNASPRCGTTTCR